MKRCSFLMLFPLLLLISSIGVAQSVVPNSYKNITYLRASGMNLQLDAYVHPDQSHPAPVLVYFHGGGWAPGYSRPSSYTTFNTFLSMGMSAVTADYRDSGVAGAPAAVQDTRCVLAWIAANAKTYNFDVNRIVIYGTSAGGHLAMMGGMLRESDGYDTLCPGPVPRVAAILDYYGITDVDELLYAPYNKSWANNWIGNGANRDELAKQMSPLTYVRPGLPPFFIVQGDADPTVPYEQNVRMRQALMQAGVPVTFFTVPDGGHGSFTAPVTTQIQNAIGQMLDQQKITHSSSTSSCSTN